ncbi:MAG: hypothetical protein JWM56_408, partial [Candidatus Peribacteria bacterium]|nr:hypothetical protein [Candidatus Peribacteria bacterium]
FHHSYSRYPVFGESLDDIRGQILSRDILSALAQGKDDELVETLMQDILIVPAAMRNDRLLTLFRNRYIHIAIVQEHGKTVGVVTLEDVLEELVGEIEDEADKEKPKPRIAVKRR